MTKLVYHDPTAPDPTSVFDQSVIEVVTGQSLQIACPYLNLNYLKGILERGGKQWKLLTDIEELLRSQAPSNRSQFADFINSHQSHIRHLARLHAKVIIAGEKAILGSANFTKSGIRQRTEMSVVLSNRENVEEMRRWFSLLWEQCEEVESSKLEMLVSSLPAEPSHGEDFPRFLAPGVIVQTHLVGTKKSGSKTIEEHLSVCHPNIRDIFERFVAKVKEIDNDIQENSRLNFVAYRARQNFVQINFRSNRLEVCLRPGKYNVSCLADFGQCCG